MDNYKQKPWYTLDIKIDNAIQSNFDFDKLWNDSVFTKASNGSWGVWHFQGNEKFTIVTPEWVKYMHDINLEVGSIILFYRKPHYVHYGLHVDTYNKVGKPEFSNYALNWVVNGNDASDMVWYDWPSQEGTLETYSDELGGFPYYYWPNLDHEPTEIASRRIGKTPTVVNVGILC